MRLKRGIKDGIPIALGYFSVSFAYAVLARKTGFPIWFPILVSATNFTGTGQFVGTELIAAGAAIAELFSAMLIINIRYTLMSLSLSQKMGSDFPLWQRAIIAFGVTDENYAVAIRQPQKLTMSYLLGLMGCSFAGWVGGTVCGAALGDVFPPSLMSAFGIALYAMFVAIIIPPSRSDKSVLFLVCISTAASCLFYFTPVLNTLSEGWVIIIASVFCTTIAALLFPRKEPASDQNTSKQETPNSQNNTDIAANDDNREDLK